MNCICGTKLKSRRKFCSISCANRARRGETRVNRELVCLECESEFYRKHVRQKFCSRNCSTVFNNRKFPKREKVVAVPLRTKVELWLSNEWDGNTKNGLSEAIRKYLLEINDFKCELCGWAGINPVSNKSTLQVDHIDGNCYNNNKSNLRVLCPNCHSLTPNFGALNKGNGRKFRYNAVVV